MPASTFSCAPSRVTVKTGTLGTAELGQNACHCSPALHCLPHDDIGCRQIGSLARCLYGGWPQEGHSCCLLQRAAAEPSWQNRVKATPWHCWLQSVREKKKERHNRARAPPRRRECSPLPYDQAARYTRSDRLSNTLIPSRSQPSVGEGSHRRGSAGPVVTGLPLGSTSDEDAWLTEDLA